MSANQQRILFTKPLSEHRKALLEQMVEVTEVKALEPVLLPISELPEPKEWIIVTSPNALESIRTLLQQGWGKDSKWATVGFRSHEKIGEFGIPTTIKANHGKDLVSKLPESGSAQYLCGKDRTPAVENYLSANDWDFETIETYWTQATHPQVNFDNFDAVCFFSPRNVTSVLRHNEWPESGTDALAIGPTTAEALEKEGITPLVVPDTPDVLLLTQHYLELKAHGSSK